MQITQDGVQQEKYLEAMSNTFFADGMLTG